MVGNIKCGCFLSFGTGRSPVAKPIDGPGFKKLEAHGCCAYERNTHDFILSLSDSQETSMTVFQDRSMPMNMAKIPSPSSNSPFAG